MKRSRITTEPSFHDLVDVLGRGSTDEWHGLYQRAKTDPKLREDIRAALEFVDPELGATRKLWIYLLTHIEQPDSIPTQRSRT